jgi:aspartate aminotransferase
VSPEQVNDLTEHAHVYLTKDGRISMAGLNEANVEVSAAPCVGNRARADTNTGQYFAESMSKAVKGELGGKAAL